MFSRRIVPSGHVRPHSWTVAILLAASGLSCGDDDTLEPPTPTTLEKLTGDEQSGQVSEALPDPLVVRVLDQTGRPIAGVNVSWVAQGGGSVSPETVPTDAAGLASAVRVLGETAGEQTTTAEVSGLQGSPVRFTSTAVDDDDGPGPL
jgi:hypothetical protein